VSALIALALTAGAAEIVLYDGNVPDEVAAAVTAISAEADPVVRTLSDLVDRREPILRGAGTIAGCDGKRLPASHLRDRLKSIEGAWLYQEFVEAQGTVHDTVGELACLEGPVPTQLLVRLHYLDALARFQNEDEPGAASAFDRALSIDSDFAWDANFADDSKRILDIQKAAMAEWATVYVEVVPIEGATVDGRAVPKGGLEVNAGMHLIQAGSGDRLHGYLLEVDEGSQVTVVAPAATPVAALQWVALDDRQRELSLLLAALTERDEVVWIVQDDSIWKGVPSKRSWDKVGEWVEPKVHAPEPVAPDPTPPDDSVTPEPIETSQGLPKEAITIPLTAMGAGIGAFGGTFAASNVSKAKTTAAEADGLTASTDNPEIAEINSRLKGYNRNIAIGDALVVVGVGVAVVGIVTTLSGGKQKAVHATPTGVGVRF